MKFSSSIYELNLRKKKSKVKNSYEGVLIHFSVLDDWESERIYYFNTRHNSGKAQMQQFQLFANEILQDKNVKSWSW